MNHFVLRRVLAPLPTAAGLLAMCLAVAHAEPAAPAPVRTLHPAVQAQARAAGIDPNLFIVQPPASVTWLRPHSNGEHPAVLVARRGGSASTVDSNTFLVQPPAQVSWRVEPEAEAPTRLAGRHAAAAAQ